MPSRHVSIRMDQDAFERLEAESRRNREPLSTLAKRLIDEGLRMEKHPGVVFKSGPTGRRAALVAGPDVWEIVRAFQQMGGMGDEQIQALASDIEISPFELRTALRYYAAFAGEINDRIEADRLEAESAQSTFLAEQRLAHV